MAQLSSTAMKRVIAEQLQSYDCIESEAQQLASQRGWEINTGSDLSKMIKLRVQLKIRRSDSAIAELLIGYHTSAMIQGLKVFHCDKCYDTPINNLFQKLLFCQSYSIRQLHPFL